MYRKFTNSVKSSRKDRLAQLSEQESVIEKKKREILAKIEAKKKKESENALTKIQPPNIMAADKALTLTSELGSRSSEVKNEHIRAGHPRNAFSNDGSFLDQFKKLSSSGLDPKNLDLAFLTKTQKKDEDSSDVIHPEKEEKKLINKKFTVNENESFKSDSLIEHHLKLDHDQKNVKPGRYSIDSDPRMVSSTSTSLSQSETSSFSCGTEAVNAPLPLTIDGERKALSTCERKTNESAEEYVVMKSYPRISDSQFILVDNEKSKLTREELIFDNKTGYYQNNSKNALDSDPYRGISPALSDEDAGKCRTNSSSHSVKQVVGCEDILKGTESMKYDAPEKNSDYTSSEQSAACKTFLPSEESHSCLRQTSTGSYGTAYYDEETGDKKRHDMSVDYDSSDSDCNSKISYHTDKKSEKVLEKDIPARNKDGYQADYEDNSTDSRIVGESQKKIFFKKSSVENISTHDEIESIQKEGEENAGQGGDPDYGTKRKRRKKSRWGDEVVSVNASNVTTNLGLQLPSNIVPAGCAPAGKTPMLSKLTRSDPGLMQYARQTFGSTNLSEEDWKKAEDHYKINLLYQDMVKKRAEIDRLEKAGKFKYEYDSDEDVEGGTWEHKLRQQEMMATQLWAEELTRQAAGKHHIGDFLPPEELERFMERYNAVKQGRQPDLSDYKEFKLKEDNVGYRLLQKMGWNEGQGLGQDGSGITNPVNKALTRHENQGLGADRPDGLEAGDDEYDAYRKRMMLAYRFRPNPLNNPRRPYY